MTGTTGYLAGAESNAVVVSYGLEQAWGTAPATTFQALRMTGESLVGAKNRTRPQEVNPTAQESAAVTQQETASGGLNFALSFGTYDDLLQSLLNADWGAALAIAGAGGDIAAVHTGNKITSITAEKFAAVAVGQWIRNAGFTNLANNGFFQVTAKPDHQTLVLAGNTLVDETPAGAAVSIRGSMIRNAAVFHSLFIQKMLGVGQYLTYPGALVTGWTLNSQQGQYGQGSFTFAAKQQIKALADSSTGGVLPAPTGHVIDTVAGMQNLLLNGAPNCAVVKAVNLQAAKNGAGAQYGVGSAAAQGMLMGKLEIKGMVEVFFKDFATYDLYASETLVPLSFRQVDAAGSAYIITLPNAGLMNPKIQASGPNQPVMAQFDLEGNPDPTGSYTIQIDRFA